MRILARILLNGLGLVAAAHLLPGIHWSGGVGALLVAGFVLGAINLLVKPVVPNKLRAMIAFKLGVKAAR